MTRFVYPQGKAGWLALALLTGGIVHPLLTGASPVLSGKALAQPPSSSTSTSTAMPAPGTAASPAERAEAWRAQILARPLFSPSRRPAPSADKLDGVPRLSGIIEGTGPLRAIFMVPGHDRGIVVPLGGHIGPWHVTGIEKGRVRVRDAQGEKVLAPDRDREGNGPSPGDRFAPPSGGGSTPTLDFAPPANPDAVAPDQPSSGQSTLQSPPPGPAPLPSPPSDPAAPNPAPIDQVPSGMPQ